MKSYHILFLLTTLGIVLAIFGCQSSLSPHYQSGKSFYFSSFESEADTAGWHRFRSLSLKKDTPEKGGEHSVYISGVCYNPHAALELPSPDRDLHLQLQLFGKNLAHGGGVSLRNLTTDDLIAVTVEDSSWSSYRSSENLFVNAGDSLRLSMTSGGIYYSAMLVDLVRVEVVN